MLNLPTLPISKYRFTLEAVDSITLPTYKGSSFHGGFGHALKQISPTWFKYFYQPKSPRNLDLPRPYVILPPLDKLEHYPKGHQFHLEITLIGEATQHYAIVQAAVEYLGLRMGLGYEQGKYKILEITKSQPQPQEKVTAISHITLKFPTRLRLKSHNRLQRQAPSFFLLMQRLQGRIRTLQRVYSKNTAELTENANLLNSAKNIKIHKHNLHWDDWDRFSGSQKKWMKFGGLMGEITYSGNLQPFMKMLYLGEWLHVGGKSSFGLGKYELTKQRVSL